MRTLPLIDRFSVLLSVMIRSPFMVAFPLPLPLYVFFLLSKKITVRFQIAGQKRKGYNPMFRAHQIQIFLFDGDQSQSISKQVQYSLSVFRAGTCPTLNDHVAIKGDGIAGSGPGLIDQQRIFTQ